MIHKLYTIRYRCQISSAKFHRKEMSAISKDNQKKSLITRGAEIYQLIHGAIDVHLTAFASSAAFFLFLSLVPIVLLVCSIIPYTGIPQDALDAIVTDYLFPMMPSTVTALLQGIVDDIYSGTLLTLSLSAIATVWSAGKAFLALMRGLDAIHGFNDQNYFIARLKACFYTVVMMVVIIFLLLAVVFGRQIADIIIFYIPEAAAVLDWFLSLRFLFSILVLAVFFTVIYTWVPQKKLRFLEQIPGAVLSAALWMVFTWIFSAYVAHTEFFGAYGSLTTIVIAMLWMYYCMYLLLFGAYLNVNIKSKKS